jgi:hypothetical protein
LQGLPNSLVRPCPTKSGGINFVGTRPNGQRNSPVRFALSHGASQRLWANSPGPANGYRRAPSDVMSPSLSWRPQFQFLFTCAQKGGRWHIRINRNYTNTTVRTRKHEVRSCNNAVDPPPTHWKIELQPRRRGSKRKSPGSRRAYRRTAYSKRSAGWKTPTT